MEWRAIHQRSRQRSSNRLYLVLERKERREGERERESEAGARFIEKLGSPFRRLLCQRPIIFLGRHTRSRGGGAAPLHRKAAIIKFSLCINTTNTEKRRRTDQPSSPSVLQISPQKAAAPDQREIRRRRRRRKEGRKFSGGGTESRLGCKLWRPLIGIGIEPQKRRKEEEEDERRNNTLPNFPREGGRESEDRGDNPERGELRAPYEIKEGLRETEREGKEQETEGRKEERGRISQELIAARYPHRPTPTRNVPYCYYC